MEENIRCVKEWAMCNLTTHDNEGTKTNTHLPAG